MEIIALAAAAITPVSTACAAQDCAERLVPSPDEGAIAPRATTPEDLLSLRDIGQSYATVDAATLTLSPDGRSIAFPMRVADAERNRYCTGIFVKALDTDSAPVAIDTGDEVVTGDLSQWGVVVPYNFPSPIRPNWSPDGTRIAFLKKRDGRTQVWSVRPDGGGGGALTASTSDVTAFAWSAGGANLVYSARPALDVRRREIEADARDGYRYGDGHFPMSMSGVPYPLDPIEIAYFAVDVATGTTRAATDSERALLIPPVNGIQPARNAINNDTPFAAWMRRSDPDRVYSPMIAAASLPGGVEIDCRSYGCEHVIDLWTAGKGNDLFYLQRQGWGLSEMALYRWRPGAGAPRRLLITKGNLAGCQAAARDIVCGFELSTEPRRLVRIDGRTGAMRTLFDPNPIFRRLSTGKVKRLHWTNDFGIETFADLVLPVQIADHGTRLPMVVTTYTSRGFLRGATGDEVPIFALVARGYAVLSLGGVDKLAAASRFAIRV